MTATPPLPNFLLAGVPRAGTTALYHALRRHPQVYMSPIKEPTYFGAADLLATDSRARVLPYAVRSRAAVSPYLDATPPPGPQPLVLDWDAYRELFRNARDEIAIGEASVSYFALPSAAGAIRDTLPHARLLFMLRDPAERLFSRYSATLQAGRGQSFREWVRASMHTEDEWSPTLGVGRYAPHLQRYLDTFARHQLRIYLYEDYRADASAVLRDICTFLGIDPDYPVDAARRHNETMAPRFPWLHHMRRRALGDLPLTGWLPRGTRLALQNLYRRRRARMAMASSDRRLVVDYYREDIERTAALLGRDLSAWLR